MGRKYIGLGPEERERKAEQKILRLLPEEKEVSWQFLAKEAEKQGISKATLSKHLKRFVNLNLVSRRVDASTYPPRTYYKKTVEIMFKNKPPCLIKDVEEIILDNNISFDIKLTIIKYELLFLRSHFAISFLFSFLKAVEDEETRELITKNEIVSFEDFLKISSNFLHTIIKFMNSLDSEKKTAVRSIFLENYGLLALEDVEKIEEILFELKGSFASFLIKKIGEKYELSEDEWVDVQSSVYCMVADDRSAEEIEKFIEEYLKDKKKKQL